jgi:hypothetical protein
VTKRKAPSNTFRERPQDINRKGRPRVGLTFAELVREVMQEPDHQSKKTKVEAMVDIAMKLALKGKFQFWDALVARGYGKVPDKIEMTQEQPFDPSKYTDEELAQLKALLEKGKP